MALEELTRREPIFHRSEFGTTRADFEPMTDETLWEIDTSGKIYERAFVLDELGKRHKTLQNETLEPTAFRLRELAPNTYLLHYDLLQGERKTRRTTVWKRTEEGWKIVFHQGTVVEG